MALVLSPSPMTTSILLRPPPFPSPFPSPSPSPSPVSTPLPALQPDLSSSSSSTSDSYPDLHHASSANSTRRIRFAPLPEPSRDLLLDPHDAASDEPHSDTKSATQPVSHPDDLHEDSLALSPSVSLDSTLSSVRSTPTIRLLPDAPKNASKSNLKLFRPFAFLRRSDSSSSKSSLSQSPSLPDSRSPSVSSFPHSSTSLPSSPSLQSSKSPRISTEDIFSFGRMSLFRPRSGSQNATRPRRASSPPPWRSDTSKSTHHSTSTSSMKQVDGKPDRDEGPSQSHNTVVTPASTPHKRHSSSSALAPGAGGGRHTSSLKMLPNTPSTRPSTAPGSTSTRPTKYVKMLNGRVYGAKRYAAQTLANPFANVRDDPEFVEWGYGGMGSVDASVGIGNDMWKGLQRSERGGALLAGSSFVSPPASIPESVTAGGSRGDGTHAASPTGRRKMSVDVPECGMGNVSTGGGRDEDDGSGMGWVKRRRAEREAKARLEQEAKERTQEKRRSNDSMDASMYASTASATPSLTACTSTASTDLTTPTTSPLSSRSPSLTDLKLTSSPSETRDFHTVSPYTLTGEQFPKSGTAPPSKDEHHVLTAVRLSPNISSPSRKYERAPWNPVQTHNTAGTNSSGDDEEESNRGSDEEEEQDAADNEEDESGVQDVRKTALGAGVEKISRHMDVESR